MSNTSAVVTVGDHFFGVLDLPAMPLETGDWSNGLVRALSSGALIYTGIDRGTVNVTVSALEETPNSAEELAWDEIVECSVLSRYGNLRVNSPQRGPVEALPLLSSGGPGAYRLRVHARGRDLNYDRVKIEPMEDYLLCIWPSESAPTITVRATDNCGAGLRQAESRYPTKVQPIGAEQIAPDEHEALLHQRILKARNREARN